jgi:PPK2 family polyphosphate:nucleotide phosphotransferase
VVESLAVAVGALRVEPGTPARIRERDPRDMLGLDKATGKELLGTLHERLAVLQQRLYAEAQRSVLLVLQGLDASGKDGVIRSVFTGLNPLSCRAVAFKAPSTNELSRDYLWRVHAATPARGEIGIFNRSHYEDVVTVRVKELAPEAVWRRRPSHIREWERLLTDEGTTFVKVYLNVSKEKQRTRLQKRIDNPEKRWKFRLEDLDTRRQFEDFVDAYEDALTQTSTEWAPWHVVPADRNWVKAVAVAQLLVDALEQIDPQLPPADPAAEGLEVD